MDNAIIEILKSIGAYEKARQLVTDDAELVRLFQDDFWGLIEKVLAQ